MGNRLAFEKAGIIKKNIPVVIGHAIVASCFAASFSLILLMVISFPLGTFFIISSIFKILGVFPKKLAIHCGHLTISNRERN